MCKLELVDGEVDYPTRVADTVLDEQERTDGTCLSCRAVPQTDVTVRLRTDDKLKCVAPLLAGLSARPLSVQKGP